MSLKNRGDWVVLVMNGVGRVVSFSEVLAFNERSRLGCIP